MAGYWCNMSHTANHARKANQLSQLTMVKEKEFEESMSNVPPCEMEQDRKMSPDELKDHQDNIRSINLSALIFYDWNVGMMDVKFSCSQPARTRKKKVTRVAGDDDEDEDEDE
jgi:hypothetical protein